ncbi:hypothetical protein FISHEDRAFT_79132 [Fistulina hepatica ATCC 64428]|uniref:Uncharacterized protein n=1 Tax=Fistulina hepatica ATCC 64428 TaxID=1128425 RepID=A0A0D7A068_9AGAR|nr:hypothetical protein FISHEDRAFT_79132 [Fistulina hepatica ATCC 64428]
MSAATRRQYLLNRPRKKRLKMLGYRRSLEVGDLVKSTMGPKGMNEILQCASALDNAATKILVNIPRVQDDKPGNGTTTFTTVLASFGSEHWF